MDLQTLVKAFEDAVQTQRNVRLGHLEDGNFADAKEAGRLSGWCSGLKHALGLFGDTVRNLLNTGAPADNTAMPSSIDSTATPTDSSSNV